METRNRIFVWEEGPGENIWT